MTRYLGPTHWKERTDFHKFPSELHIYTVCDMCAQIQTHTHNQLIKCNNFLTVSGNWVAYSKACTHHPASWLWQWYNWPLLQCCSPDSLPWWTVYPELWAKTNPFILTLFLSEHFIITTGKETKTVWISIHLLMVSFLYNSWGKSVKRKVLGLWHLPQVVTDVGWVGLTFTPGIWTL